jgi:CBS domain-containing protein
MGILSKMLRRRAPVLYSFPPDASVAQAVQTMAEKQVGIVPIVEAGRLVGVFSERDLLRRVIAAQKSTTATSLREVMTPNPVTATPDETRQAAIKKMHDRGCRHLPIMRNGVLVDMLSMRDLLWGELSDKEQEIRVLQDYIQGQG